MHNNIRFKYFIDFVYIFDLIVLHSIAGNFSLDFVDKLKWKIVSIRTVSFNHNS